MKLNGIALVLLFGLIYAGDRTQSARNDEPASGTAADGPISLELQEATLTDVVTLLGQKYGVNIVADAYSDNTVATGARNVKIDNVPLRAAIPKLAELYQ